MVIHISIFVWETAMAVALSIDWVMECSIFGTSFRISKADTGRFAVYASII
jgi:hypothetical protein